MRRRLGVAAKGDEHGDGGHARRRRAGAAGPRRDGHEVVGNRRVALGGGEEDAPCDGSLHHIGRRQRGRLVGEGRVGGVGSARGEVAARLFRHGRKSSAGGGDDFAATSTLPRQLDVLLRAARASSRPLSSGRVDRAASSESIGEGFSPFSKVAGEVDWTLKRQRRRSRRRRRRVIERREGDRRTRGRAPRRRGSVGHESRRRRRGKASACSADDRRPPGGRGHGGRLQLRRRLVVAVIRVRRRGDGGRTDAGSRGRPAHDVVSSARPCEGTGDDAAQLGGVSAGLLRGEGAIRLAASDAR